MTTKKILVLGSTSFSGAYFVREALQRQFEVFGISRSPEPDPVFLPYHEGEYAASRFNFFQYDLNHDIDTIIDITKDIKPEYIINFAAQGMVAQSWKAPDQWFMTNFVSAVKLHQALINSLFLKKFVQVSTPEVYGNCHGSIVETNGYYPSTPYAVSKAAVDMSLMSFFRQYGFPVVFTRAANIYGPCQQLYRIIPKAVLCFLKKEPIELHGGGKSVRSFVHIQDVVEGTFSAMLSEKNGQIYHFATNEYISIKELVKLICKKLCVPFDQYVKNVEDRPGKDDAYLLNCVKSENELGWKSTISLDNGLDKTIVWVKNHFDILKEMPCEYLHKP
ncbi:MAG: GDP-mannose 4,6-dehydratase [Proteobacteria bacterium]|nr:GDP-mannose 4,6-dehydratase [Pseudomonadota bacterium]